MKRKLACWLSSCFLFIPPSWAGALSLQDAVDKALSQAPGFAAAEQKRAAAAEDVVLARAWLMPLIQASGSFRRINADTSYDKPVTVFPVRELNYQRTEYALTLVQPLFRLDRWAHWKQGQLADGVAEDALALARQSLILEVAGRYLDVLTAEAAVQADRSQEAAMQALAKQAETAFSAGTATINDKLEAASRLDMLRAVKLVSENRLVTMKARLASLIGEPVQEVESLSAHAVLSELAKDEQAWKKQGMEQALSVRMASKQLASAEYAVDASLGGALPSVDLVYGLDHTRATNNNFGSGSTIRSQSIGVEVTVPLYAGGGTWAQLRKSRKQQTQAEYELVDEKRQAGLVAQEAWLNCRASTAQLQAYEQALHSAEQNMKAADVAYQAGLRSLVERLDAEQRLSVARRDLASARAGVVMSRLQLAASVGQLAEETLQEVSGMFDAGDEGGHL